ncbi:MAG: CBS domain-containing protein [Anaerolineae bacterium]|nr:CBS domain-containing protein [Anaerolineae bacterium]MCK4471509.1 CBS domain-containing protein [Anaerolineae bacterium]
MLVKDYMTRHPLMAGPTMSIVEAQRYMGENNIRHLPVVGDGKRLLGLVTRQTLLIDPGRLGSLDIWEIARYLSGLTVKDVMTKAKDVIVVEPNITIEEAARIMVENKIGCLPVVEEDIVVGIITEIDLLAHLMEMMATRVPGVRVTVRMPNVKGELAKLVGAISAQGWGILACGGAPAPKEPGKWDAVVKIRYVPREEIVAALGQVEGQEIVDVREI